MGQRKRVGVATLLGSLALHGGLVALVMSIPERPEPEPPPDPEPLELVWLEAPQPAPVAPPPIEPVAPAVQDPPESAAPRDVTPQRPSSPARPSRSTPSPGAPESSPGQAEPSEAPPSGGDAPGLSLSGLRGPGGGASSAGGTVPPPVVALGPDVGKPKAPVQPEGPVLPRLDKEPRSLEEAGFRRRKDGSYRFWKPGAFVTVTIQPDGRVAFRDRALSVQGTQSGHGGSVAQRMAGEERFKGLKAKILRQTFALRMQMAESWSRKQMRRELVALGKQLQRTWTRDEWPAQRRRKVLFSLWDDCEEVVDDNDGKSVDATLDRARKETGMKARKKILAFIRAELPKGSADAYPDAELQALNASRRSRQRFTPY